MYKFLDKAYENFGVRSKYIKAHEILETVMVGHVISQNPLLDFVYLGKNLANLL